MFKSKSPIVSLLPLSGHIAAKLNKNIACNMRTENPFNFRQNLKHFLGVWHSLKITLKKTGTTTITFLCTLSFFLSLTQFKLINN